VRWLLCRDREDRGGKRIMAVLAWKRAAIKLGARLFCIGPVYVALRASGDVERKGATGRGAGNDIHRRGTVNGGFQSRAD